MKIRGEDFLSYLPPVCVCVYVCSAFTATRKILEKRSRGEKNKRGGGVVRCVTEGGGGEMTQRGDGERKRRVIKREKMDNGFGGKK